MRYTTRFFIMLLLAGCAGSPPRPPAVQGEYRPINKTIPKDTGVPYPRPASIDRGHT